MLSAHAVGRQPEDSSWTATLQPLDKQHPENAVNRRISIILTQPLLPADVPNVEVSNNTSPSKVPEKLSESKTMSVSGVAERWRSVLDERTQRPPFANSPEFY